MQGILKKIGAFLERHVEKIVLAIFGLLSLWLLFTSVAFSPNKVALDGSGPRLAPGQIDDTIRRAYYAAVQERLAHDPEPKPAYASRLTGVIDPNDPVVEGLVADLSRGFLGLVSRPLAHLEEQAPQILPSGPVLATANGRGYRLPPVGPVMDVDVEHYRAAMYVPVEPVTEETDYASVATEVNDVDFVTVQGRFNVARLRDQFYRSFASEALPDEWRDPQIARPVFTAVELQRQEQLPDGRWGPWQRVPRPRIDGYADLFEIVEDVDQLPPGGIRARMLKLEQGGRWMSLLQPVGYAFASTYDDWYPPVLHRDYLAALEKERLDERRQERGTRQGAAAGRRGAAGAGDLYGGGGGRGGAAAGGRRTLRPGARGGRGGEAGLNGPGGLYGGEMVGRGGVAAQSPVMEIQRKLRDLLLTPRTRIEDLDEVTFWAHDDRVEPGKTYRYRLRLGVANPVAGTNNTRPEDAALRRQCILWSDFSEPTAPVAIPLRVYLFARDYTAPEGPLSVEVAKFFMGYWRSEVFDVSPGETVGTVKEVEKPETDPLGGYGGEVMMDMGMDMPFGGQQQATANPDEIDYRTDTLFVDAVPVRTWTGDNRLREQQYVEALFTSDGVRLERMPVGSPYWPERISQMYGVIKKSQSQEIEEFKGFDLGLMGTRGRGVGGRGGLGVYGGAYGG